MHLVETNMLQDRQEFPDIAALYLCNCQRCLMASLHVLLVLFFIFPTIDPLTCVTVLTLLVSAFNDTPLLHYTVNITLSEHLLRRGLCS